MVILQVYNNTKGRDILIYDTKLPLILKYYTYYAKLFENIYEVKDIQLLFYQFVKVGCRV